MESLHYFFRATPDSVAFSSFSTRHLLILAVAALGSLSIFWYRKKLRRPEYEKKLWWFFLISLSAQQILLYGWYITTGFSSVRESLPLYHCRVAIICTIVGLITDNRLAKSFAILWGIIGSIVALLLPNPDPFFFPHFTLVSFFAGHVLLLWAGLYLLLVQEFKLEEGDLSRLVILTNVFHLWVYLLNRLIESNYCYLMYPPFSMAFLAHPFGRFLYTPVVFALFTFVIIAFYNLVQSQYFEFDKSPPDYSI